MKIEPCFLSLLFASLAASKSLPFFGTGQTILNDENLKVPGENPLKLCQPVNGNILTIDYVNISPDPPAPGKTLSIEAKGTFHSEVTNGAYIFLSVKYGLITLIRQTSDLCEQMKNVNEECPLHGERVIRKDVELPSVIPPGKYTVRADVYTGNDLPVICLEATVHL